eukprot:4161094-Amphidinium_carterae.1
MPFVILRLGLLGLLAVVQLLFFPDNGRGPLRQADEIRDVEVDASAQAPGRKASHCHGSKEV